ncbi:MAG: hypothetical protein P8L17_06270, partial [Methylophilaceae bacterium]|nr:hypothetical protein [Methylophilaceae bacterium]
SRNPLGGTFPEYLLICKPLIYKGIPWAGLIDRARIGPNGGLLGDINMSGVHVMGWWRCHEQTTGTKKPERVRLSWLLVAG